MSQLYRQNCDKLIFSDSNLAHTSYVYHHHSSRIVMRSPRLPVVMVMDDDDVLCAVFKVKFLEGDKQIQCEGCCQYWFHINCANVSDEDFIKICELGDNSH